MQKRGIAFFILAVIIIFLASGCADLVNNEDDKLPAFEKSTAEYSDKLDSDTPEGLAYMSSESFKKMINGMISVEDLFNTLLELTPDANRDKMSSEKSRFLANASSTKDIFASEKNSIVRFEYGKTEYKDPEHASIYRIQIHKNGDRYYFIQSFILENGKWKIQGDNPVNDFRWR